MRVPSVLATAAIVFIFQRLALAAKNDFNPSSFPKQTVACKAVNRVANTTTSILLNYVEVNPEAETTLIMVHGWPSLWSTWSYQIQEFKNDYHLIAPDLRGFGSSTHPDDVESSGTMGDMVGDLVCILEHASVRSAICMGHDWGAQVCYEAARMRPDIFNAVVGIVIPYIPSAGPFVPIAQFVPVFPALSYQLFFEDSTAAAIVELEQNITRTLRGTLRSLNSPPPADFLKSTDSFMSGWKDVAVIPPIPFFTIEEEDYMVEQYGIQGFKNTLQFYTRSNKYLSWEFTHNQGNYTISQPALYVMPLHDPVADWTLVSRMLHSEEFLSNLKTVIFDGAHWIHLERPAEFNAALRDWLDGLSPETKGILAGRPVDEL
jgi:soluble epoxide hydrolase/lipid-phosphate phosphatase